MGRARRALLPRQLVDLLGEQADAQHADEVSRPVLDRLQRRDRDPALLRRQLGVLDGRVEVGPDRAAIEGRGDRGQERRVLGGVGDRAGRTAREGRLRQRSLGGPLPLVDHEAPVLQRGMSRDDAPAVEDPRDGDLPRRAGGASDGEGDLGQPRVRDDLGEERGFEREGIVGANDVEPDELLDVFEDALRLVQLVLDLDANGAAGLLPQRAGAIHDRVAPAAEKGEEEGGEQHGDAQPREQERPAEGQAAPLRVHGAARLAVIRGG